MGNDIETSRTILTNMVLDVLEELRYKLSVELLQKPETNRHRQTTIVTGAAPTIARAMSGGAPDRTPPD